MKFPDSTVNALLILALAAIATGAVNFALRTLLGDPQSAVVTIVLAILVFVIGFGIVYSPYAIQARRKSMA